MKSARLLWLACSVVIGGLACKDAPEPFALPGPEPLSGNTWRLTYNSGDDRAPAWTPDGERIVYSAEGLDDDIVDNPGLLVSIPYRGGTAERIFPDAQADTGALRWFTTPAASPTGDHFAFAHVIRTHASTLCDEVVLVDCDDSQQPALPEPQLDTIAFRVAKLAAGDPLPWDLSTGVRFAGRSFDPTPQPGGLNGVWLVEYHPFQRLYLEEGMLIFRPAWSSDGGRIVFSDGLRILIWDLQTGAVQPVAGTEDGVTPAWSPDGEWIAFTRLERGAARSSYCLHIAETGREPVVSCAEQRTEYEVARRVIMLVRPDGSELIELGEGDEPAWGPEGDELFYRFSDRIWRHSSDSGELREVPETAGAREPAVAPDGQYLAFSRPDAGGRYSIWIVRLENRDNLQQEASPSSFQ